MNSRLSLLLIFAALTTTAPAQQPARRAPGPGTRPRATAAPPGPTALLALAKTQAARGDRRGAITSLTQALRAAPNSTELLYQYAQLAMRMGSPAETVRAMTAATRLEPDQPDYLYLLGIGQLWVGDVEAAANPLGRAAELAPERAEMQLGYGVALHALKRYDNAVPALEKVLVADAENAEALYLLADIAQMRGDPDAALRLAARSLAKNPRHAGANLVRGIALAQQGKFTAARAALELSVAADPSFPRTYYQLGRVYAQLGDATRAAAARASFDKATKQANEQQLELRRLLKLAPPAASPAAKPKTARAGPPS